MNKIKIMVIVGTKIVSYYIKNYADNISLSVTAPTTSAGIHTHLSAGKMIQYHQMGYPRVTTGTETHMVTRTVIRTNIYMVNKVTHMEITLITTKMTIAHIEIGVVVHETARMLIKITHMERSGTIRVNQIF